MQDTGVAGVSFGRAPGTKRAKTPTKLAESKTALTTSAAAGEAAYGGDVAAEMAVPGEAIASTVVRQGDMTVNTRDAFSATNSMFQARPGLLQSRAVRSSWHLVHQYLHDMMPQAPYRLRFAERPSVIEIDDGGHGAHPCLNGSRFINI